MVQQKNPNTAIATISSAELAQETTFTPRQVDLIREQIMPNAADEELMLFVQVASSRGLDPFRKHIYAVSRRTKVGNNWVDKWSYQVSIDGLRLIAERTGKYEGQTPPEWCGPDGKWTDVWLSDDPPAAARVGVYKKGTRAPLYAVALYKTFVQKYTPQGSNTPVPTKFWSEMPEHMLAKCAESQALRKAFPEEAGGLYTTEEMAQASNPPRGEIIDVATGEIVDDPALHEGFRNAARDAAHGRQQPRQATKVTATISQPQDSARQKAAADLWRLARDSFGWDQATLELVAQDRKQARLEDLGTDDLQELYMELVGMGPQEREAMIAVLGTPSEGEGAA